MILQSFWHFFKKPLWTAYCISILIFSPFQVDYTSKAKNRTPHLTPAAPPHLHDTTGGGFVAIVSPLPVLKESPSSSSSSTTAKTSSLITFAKPSHDVEKKDHMLFYNVSTNLWEQESECLI